MEEQFGFVVVLFNSAVLWVDVFVVNKLYHLFLFNPSVLSHRHRCVNFRDQFS